MVGQGLQRVTSEAARLVSIRIRRMRCGKRNSCFLNIIGSRQVSAVELRKLVSSNLSDAEPRLVLLI